MSFLGDLFARFEDQLIRLLEPILGPLRPLVTIFTHLRDNTIGIIDAGNNLIRSTENVIDKIKNFTVQPAFKNRVISVPRVQDNVQRLFEIPGQIVAAIKDLIEQVRGRLQPEKFNVDELEGLEDLRGIIRKLGTKIAAAFEKILGIVTLVVDTLVTIRSTITDLQTIVDGLNDILDDITNLDGLFLPQNNPRRIERLEAGGSIKIRVGNLHS